VSGVDEVVPGPVAVTDGFPRRVARPHVRTSSRNCSGTSLRSSATRRWSHPILGAVSMVNRLRPARNSSNQPASIVRVLCGVTMDPADVQRVLENTAFARPCPTPRTVDYLDEGRDDSYGDLRG
jgi:hypothetical protein